MAHYLQKRKELWVRKKSLSLSHCFAFQDFFSKTVLLFFKGKSREIVDQVLSRSAAYQDTCCRLRADMTAADFVSCYGLYLSISSGFHSYFSKKRLYNDDRSKLDDNVILKLQVCWFLNIYFRSRNISSHPCIFFFYQDKMGLLETGKFYCRRWNQKLPCHPPTFCISNSQPGSELDFVYFHVDHKFKSYLHGQKIHICKLVNWCPLFSLALSKFK